MFNLNWQSTLSYDDTINYVGRWYQNYQSNDVNLFEFSLNQIEQYEIKNRTKVRETEII